MSSNSGIFARVTYNAKMNNQRTESVYEPLSGPSMDSALDFTRYKASIQRRCTNREAPVEDFGMATLKFPNKDVRYKDQEGNEHIIGAVECTSGYETPGDFITQSLIDKNPTSLIYGAITYEGAEWEGRLRKAREARDTVKAKTATQSNKSLLSLAKWW